MATELERKFKLINEKIPDFCDEELTNKKECSNIYMAVNGTWK